MLSDANPMVVANAIAALSEIQEQGGQEVLQITPHTLFKLLAALNECTEWGQVRCHTWSLELAPGSNRRTAGRSREAHMVAGAQRFACGMFSWLGASGTSL